MSNKPRKTIAKLERDLAYANEAVATYLAEASAVQKELDSEKHARASAEHLVARMHQAALGEVRGPIRGVVEDVTDLREQRDQAKDRLRTLRDAIDRAIHVLADDGLAGDEAAHAAYMILVNACAPRRGKAQGQAVARYEVVLGLDGKEGP